MLNVGSASHVRILHDEMLLFGSVSASTRPTFFFSRFSFQKQLKKTLFFHLAENCFYIKEKRCIKFRVAELGDSSEVPVLN